MRIPIPAAHLFLDPQPVYSPCVGTKAYVQEGQHLVHPFHKFLNCLLYLLYFRHWGVPLYYIYSYIINYFVIFGSTYIFVVRRLKVAKIQQLCGTEISPTFFCLFVYLFWVLFWFYFSFWMWLGKSYFFIYVKFNISLLLIFNDFFYLFGVLLILLMFFNHFYTAKEWLYMQMFSRQYFSTK